MKTDNRYCYYYVIGDNDNSVPLISQNISLAIYFKYYGKKRRGGGVFTTKVLPTDMLQKVVGEPD